MKAQTTQKLTILQDRQVISKETKEKVESIDTFLQSTFATFEDHDSDFLFTHLAMAIDRVSKANQITEVNEIILDQIKQSDTFPRATKLLSDISNMIGTSFNDAESVMILVHFCSLIEMRG